MPTATLSVTIPESVWIGDLSRRYPDTTVRVLSAFGGDDAGVGLAELTGPDVEDVLARLNDYDDVTEATLLDRTDERALVQFETTLPLLLSPVRDSGAPMQLPFDIADGQARWEVTASRARLSRLGEQLDALGIRYTVERVRRDVGFEQLLTDRQQTVLVAAVEAGYYDTPRECSLTDLAADLDLAKSTVSETLHRAEEHVVKQFVSERRSTESLGVDATT
jgi:predicted DNA binding protein